MARALCVLGFAAGAAAFSVYGGAGAGMVARRLSSPRRADRRMTVRATAITEDQPLKVGIAGGGVGGLMTAYVASALLQLPAAAIATPTAPPLPPHALTSSLPQVPHEAQGL